MDSSLHVKRKSDSKAHYLDCKILAESQIGRFIWSIEVTNVVNTAVLHYKSIFGLDLTASAAHWIYHPKAG